MKKKFKEWPGNKSKESEVNPQTKKIFGIVVVTILATLFIGRMFGDVGAGGFLIGVGFITFIYSQLNVSFEKRKGK